MSDDIAIGVETSLRKFNLNELDDIVRKEKNDRSIVKIIDESQWSYANVKHILTVVVHQNASQVLLVPLRGLQHSKKTN